MTSAGTQNLYSYVGNNPVNFVDPTGHNAIALILGGAVVAAAIIYIAAEAMFSETHEITLENSPPIVEQFVEKIQSKVLVGLLVWTC